MDRNQALQEYTGWLHTVARSMTTGPMHDDLVQEGYISMWRALGSYDPTKGALDFWLKRSAFDRMRIVISGGTMTTSLERKSSTGFTQPRGDETRRRIAEYVSKNPGATGSQIASELGISPATVSYQRAKAGAVATSQALSGGTVSLDSMADAGWDLEGPDHLDGIAVAYHAGEICEALEVLTPAQRKYVVARFWGGMTPTELRALFGYDPSSLWRDAKPRLQTQLAYLRELVTS